MRLVSLSVAATIIVGCTYCAAGNELHLPAVSMLLLNPDRTVNWTGTYLGIHAGRMNITDKFVFEGGQGYGTLKDSANILGIHVGAQYQYEFVVAGVEFDISKSWIKYGYSGQTWVFKWGYNNAVDWQATARGRLGIAFDRFLVYAAGGFVYMPLSGNYWYFPPEKNRKFSAIKDGYTYGFGVEYAFSDDVSIRTEFRQNSDIKSKEATSFNRHSSRNVLLGITYKY